MNFRVEILKVIKENLKKDRILARTHFLWLSSMAGADIIRGHITGISAIFLTMLMADVGPIGDEIKADEFRLTTSLRSGPFCNQNLTPMKTVQ